MNIALRQYHDCRKGPSKPLVTLRDYVAKHGAPGPDELRRLAEELQFPAAALRGALSYYSDFQADARATQVCHGTSCFLHGADRLHGHVEKAGPCRSVYCLGYCDRSPAALTPEGRLVSLHEAATSTHSLPSDMPRIRCAAREPIVTQRLLRGDHSRLATARTAGVYSALEYALQSESEQVLAAMERSGQQGRGGAGFPVGKKWRCCASAPGKPKYVIANGDEGDPGSYIDRVLMEHDPHAMLEGLLLCGYAVGAHEGIVFIRSEYPRAIEIVSNAIREAEGDGIIGDRVMGSDFSFHVSVFPGLGSYVCGEETAMLNAIEGCRGEVRVRPPYPATQGLYGNPTVINNVETLVNVPWIIRNGPDAYRQYGTPASPGTKAICLNRGFATPGIVEVECGTPLREVVTNQGGGGRDGKPLEAVILGGPMGNVLTEDQWDAPICYTAMAERDIRLGHGGVVAVLQGTDWRALLSHWLGFMEAESCGKCVPCREGSHRAVELLSRIQQGHGAAALKHLLEVISDASLCAFGQLMPKPIATVLDRWLVEAAEGTREVDDAAE